MIVSFILGIVVGISVGVLVTIRQYEKQLRAVNEQLKKCTEQLGKTNGLLMAQTARIKALEQTQREDL